MRFLILAAMLLCHSSCGKNTVYVQGPVGPTGETGSPGEAGINGTNGSDATPVYAVQLCPGTPSYPTLFPECAFCVQGFLYATFSANGGFTTLLLPGRYSSNAVGSACSFTVVSGCEISN